ncbi:hypothetical protein GCM10010319_34150 [Streptomyces blastmyceticus]|uniref:Uncharacterized protein n=1 Tax=Streptomyces blastmyceticus TaxID=68180 RepID=A0ABP3GU94_9ACTN
MNRGGGTQARRRTGGIQKSPAEKGATRVPRCRTGREHPRIGGASDNPEAVAAAGAPTAVQAEGTTVPPSPAVTGPAAGVGVVTVGNKGRWLSACAVPERTPSPSTVVVANGMAVRRACKEIPLVL